MDYFFKLALIFYCAGVKIPRFLCTFVFQYPESVLKVNNHMAEKVKYPIGEQNFKKIRDNGLLYIDKTQYIEEIADSGSMYYFLARPRRFGKSLFLSTLEYFYKGERDLFKGLYIDSSDWNWDSFPVLRLDLNTNRYDEQGKLEVVLNGMFKDWEAEYGITDIDKDYGQRFRNIIQAAHRKTGRQVVILVDEYDKPMIGNINVRENLDHYRNSLANLYSNFKSAAEHIKLVFLTGVSRFSKLSIFSDLNNLKDITFLDDFADICGITENELKEYFQTGISCLAQKKRVSYDEASRLLKQNYDGYRFAKNGSDIYNPWSLLNAMASSEILNFWNDTGRPTIVAELLKKIDADLESTLDTWCTPAELMGFDLFDPNAKALMYQTGYLTIKEYNRRLNEYRLGIPNKEVKEGFFRILVKYYLKYRTETANDLIQRMIRGFILGKPDDAMMAMQTYLAGVDYALRIEDENNFHNAFFLMTHIIGLNTKVESHTSDGRIDIEISTEDFIYVIELKYDKSAEEALDQIEGKRYSRKHQLDSRRLFEIGVNFSSSTRTIEDWKIRTFSPHP